MAATRKHVFRLTDTEQAMWDLWLLYGRGIMSQSAFARALGVRGESLSMVVTKASELQRIEQDMQHGGITSLKRARGQICMTTAVMPHGSAMRSVA